MEVRVRERLIGALVLVAIVVLFVPAILKGRDPAPAALPAAALATRISQAGAASVQAAASVAAGLEQARAGMQPEDRAVVFGSFLTVGPALDRLP